VVAAEARTGRGDRATAHHLRQGRGGQGVERDQAAHQGGRQDELSPHHRLLSSQEDCQKPFPPGERERTAAAEAMPFWLGIVSRRGPVATASRDCSGSRNATNRSTRQGWGRSTLVILTAPGSPGQRKVRKTLAR